MTDQAKAAKHEPVVDKGNPTEEVVNDSLGTIDLADSTGTDSDKQAEADKAAHTMDKRHPAQK
jgi:hypothetical protein